MSPCGCASCIGSADRDRLLAHITDGFIKNLATKVTEGFRGDVGIVPRQFLREFVGQMDLVDENDDYIPAKAYGFHPADLSPEEQQSVDGDTRTAPDNEDKFVPEEQIW